MADPLDTIIDRHRAPQEPLASGGLVTDRLLVQGESTYGIMPLCNKTAESCRYWHGDRWGHHFVGTCRDGGRTVIPCHHEFGSPACGAIPPAPRCTMGTQFCTIREPHHFCFDPRHWNSRCRVG